MELRYRWIVGYKELHSNNSALLVSFGWHFKNCLTSSVWSIYDDSRRIIVTYIIIYTTDDSYILYKSLAYHFDELHYRYAMGIFEKQKSAGTASYNELAQGL